MRQQVADAASRLRWQALHDICQVGVRFVPIRAGRVHQATISIEHLHATERLYGRWPGAEWPSLQPTCVPDRDRQRREQFLACA